MIDRKWFKHELEQYGWRTKIWLWLFATPMFVIDHEEGTSISYYEYKGVIYIREIKQLDEI